jgi:hypothetical protein
VERQARYQLLAASRSVENLGFKLILAASAANTRYVPKVVNQLINVHNPIRPKLRQHSVRNTATANTVFNTVIPQ